MLKMLFRSLCISLLLVFSACAPKPAVVPPPPVYEETVLTLEEVLEKAGGDTEALKAITDIEILKNDEQIESVSASVLVKMPDWVHVRIYKMGMLVKDFVVMGDELYVLSGKGGPNLRKFGREFHNAIFWWDNVEGGTLYASDTEYIIRAENKELRIDRATLLPLSQRLTAFERKIVITYKDPVEEQDGYWHPSVINIFAGDFRIKVELKKLLRNPEFGDFDFRVPADG